LKSQEAEREKRLRNRSTVFRVTPRNSRLLQNSQRSLKTALVTCNADDNKLETCETEDRSRRHEPYRKHGSPLTAKENKTREGEHVE
jgi:hypothetical protein